MTAYNLSHNNGPGMPLFEAIKNEKDTLTSDSHHGKHARALKECQEKNQEGEEVAVAKNQNLGNKNKANKGRCSDSYDDSYKKQLN